MSYQATVISVMIATPGDVYAEREIIRNVIHQWNDVNSSNSKVVLSPVGWETHISPELGNRPQEIINNRILEQCDLLVGVFWTRIGTPTGKAPSGTVEEIQKHTSLGKPAMVYFSSKPAAPETIDPEQSKDLKDFKESLKKLGIVEEFENEQDFKEKLSKQLQITLIHNEYLKKEIEKYGEEKASSQNVTDRQQNFSVSQEAKKLLKAASVDKDGIILKRIYIGGKHISSGKSEFGRENSREFAKWEAALNQLIQQGLVNDITGNGEIFELTHTGWTITDEL